MLREKATDMESRSHSIQKSRSQSKCRWRWRHWEMWEKEWKLDFKKWTQSKSDY